MKLGMRLARTGVSFRVIDQVVGAGTSVGANVEESHAASSRADFAHKRDIALRECRESVYWLRLLVAAETGTECGPESSPVSGMDSAYQKPRVLCPFSR